MNQERKKQSLKGTVRSVNAIDTNVLIQSDDEEKAIDVARRIHERSMRAGKPFVVFDARELPGGKTKQILDAFAEGHQSPISKAADGTLVILHLDERPEEFQHIFAKIIDTEQGSTPRRQRMSASAILPLEARVRLIESKEEKTYTDIRHMCAFIPLSFFEDDLV